MNFEIKNIESFFPENLIAEAEAIVHEDLVQKISTLDKNLWLLKVSESFEELQEKKGFEVEIQLKGNKVKACTCECDFFQQGDKKNKNHSCKHIVAGLFRLRKHLLQKQLEKQKAIRTTSAQHKKLTTVAVLNSVNGEALKNFVRAYARTDKKFALALKARFAYAVNVGDAKEKYIQLLQSTFSAVRNSKDKLNYNAVQQISSVVKDILEQMGDAIAMEHYAEAASILQAILLKLAPNIKRATNHEDKIIELMILAFSGLGGLIKKDLAPELKQDIWKFCFDEFDQKEHRKYNTQPYFFKLFLQLIFEKKQADALIEKIDEQLIYIFDQKKKGVLLLFKMKLLELFQKDHLFEFIEKNMAEPEVLLAAVHNAIQHENYTDAQHIAIKGLAIQKSILTKNKLEDYLLNIALKTQQTQDIVIYSRKRFLVTNEFHFFQILKNTIKKGWKKELHLLLDQIKSQPYFPKKKETLATIFAEEKMDKELLNHLKKIRSLDLLQKYDLQLLEKFKEDVYELYEDFLESYLRNHLGRQTSTKIRDIFFHLKKIGAKKLVYKLKKEYRIQYAERHTLMEEISKT